MPNYRLVNPLIVGKMNTTFANSTAEDAANDAWGALSSHITNNMPRLAFTIENLEDGSLSHFKVTEKVAAGTKLVDFSIQKLKVKLSAEQEKNMKANYNKMHAAVQQGGSDDKKSKKTKKDDSSSSSSTSDSTSDTDDFYKQVKRFKKKSKDEPITYWWYTPYIYKDDDDKLQSVFIPTFNTPLMPRIEIGLTDWSSAFLM